MRILPSVLLLTICAWGWACAADHPYVWADTFPEQAAQAGSVIQPNDRIFLHVKEQPTLSGELDVRADGSVVQPLVGKVDVAGLTAAQAAQRFTERLHGILERPVVTIAIIATRPPKVSVLGEVTHPGRFDMDKDEGVLGALARAGGLTEFADRDGIFVLRERPEPVRVRFRFADLAGGTAAARFRLQDGDVIVVE